MKYPHKESIKLEFKREIPSKKHSIIKTVIAFANTYGGQIIIGIDDETKIIGLPEESIDSLVDDLTRSIYDAVKPSISPSIITQRLDDRLLIIVDIAEGMHKPYFLHSKKIEESCYIRLGSQSFLATAEIIQQLQWQNQKKFIDEMPVYGASEDDIDHKAFEEFLEIRKQGKTFVNTHDMLYHYGILIKDRGKVYPSVAGILLFGKQAEKFFPEAFIICSHFSGTAGRNAIASRDSIGNLFQQYKDSIAFIISRLNTSFSIEGAEARREELEIPAEAIREILINAIAHRNYQIPAPNKIAIYDDRLEIFSPGNFPGPIMSDHLHLGISYIRNTIITKVLRDIGMVEKLGSGFIILFDSYAKRALAKPTVLEGIGFIKCILPRPSHRKKSGSLESIEQLLYQKEKIQVRDLMTYLCVSKSTAGRLLAEAIQKKLIQKVGKGPQTHYRKASLYE